MTIRLFHFSDNHLIERFQPRCVRTPSQRESRFEWLNGPLVWAIDDWHQPMYLFPRDCPRILLWRNKHTQPCDIEKYLNNTNARMIAYIEKSWLPELNAESLYRYELPISSFQSLQDAGMWVSNTAVSPIRKTCIENLPSELQEANVEVRVLDRLTPLRNAWNSSLHVSGIRLRNAQDWID